MTEAMNHYGATAARPHGRPGREARPSSRTIDVHAHVFVPEAAAVAEPHLDPSTSLPARFASPETQALNRKQEADRREVMTSIEPRLRDLDEAGIDLQVVSPVPPQCYFTLKADHAVPAIRLVNDGVAEFVARRPDRFLGLGTVAMQEPAEAVRELERCMGPLGFKGVEILTNVAGRELSDPAFEPFWAAAQRLGALVMIHPLGFTQADRFRPFYFTNLIGNPLETTIALVYLIFGGVLERYPRLKLLAVHGGGFLPAYSGRIDHAWGARSDARGALPRPPTHYLRQVYFDSVVFTPHQLEYLVKLFGADHVLMGTDYPYDMADSDPVGHVCSVAGFDAATRAAIAGGNAERLLAI